MKRIVQFSLFCLFLFLVSCNKSVSNYYSGTISEITTFKYEGELKSQLFMAADTFSYSDVFVADSLMIVGTGSSDDGIVSIYDVNRKERLLSMCRIGKGQNEYLFYKDNIPYICPENNHLIMNTFDGMTKLKEIDITESLSAGKMAVTKEENYGDKYFRTMDYNSEITIFPNHRKILRYLAYKVDSRDREYSTPKYVLEDADGKSRDIVLYPKPIYGVDDMLNPQYYRSNSAYKPDGTKIVEAMELIDLISIVDVENGQVKGLKGKDSYSLEEIADMTIETLGTKPYHVSQVHASNDYFFTVKYNFLIKDLENMAEVSPKPTIQIYNWDGEALAKLNVENDFLYSLFFDEKTEFLYTTNSKGDILYYDLKEVMKKIKS